MSLTQEYNCLDVIFYVSEIIRWAAVAVASMGVAWVAVTAIKTARGPHE